jgi:hypothetical protein
MTIHTSNLKDAKIRVGLYSDITRTRLDMSNGKKYGPWRLVGVNTRFVLREDRFKFQPEYKISG